MNIVKIKVQNYRLLKDFDLDIEKNLSLVIGKNNSGKTSLLSILNRFIGDGATKNDFSFDDFNIDFKNELKKNLDGVEIPEEDFPFLGISLKLFIQYDDIDDLTNISTIMMDLNPDNNMVVLGFEYSLTYTNYKKLRIDFAEFDRKQKAKSKEIVKADVAVETEINQGSLDEPAVSPELAEDDSQVLNLTIEKDICFFLKKNHQAYFKKIEKAIDYNIDDPANPFEDDKNYIDFSKQSQKLQFNKIVNFKYINAKREVSNKDPDKSLSSLSSKIYKKTEANEKELQAIEEFKDALSDTDIHLDGIYSKLFESVIAKVEQFGGIKKGDSIIEIISSLKDRELLEGNTTVTYKHSGNDTLPEHYNGLGYMNLIAMIFEVEILLQDFKMEASEKPADINLLFIEEPEAHTHPQMQYVFIKNIKILLGKGIQRSDGQNRALQTIISTHSSHIVSESDFEDIKYFKKEDGVIQAKNLRELIKEYALDPKQYQFLKQYLTISRAELFFADKAVLIEGDTERILLPTMMKKLDEDDEKKYLSDPSLEKEIALLSQNISIVEVGSYSEIFEKFIAFLGIKALIITDIDTVDVDSEACSVASGHGYSNHALSFFFSGSTLQTMIANTLASKIFKKTTTWEVSADGHLCVVYQTLENGYHARSFEDAFIHLNRVFVTTNKNAFRGIKNAAHFDDTTKSAYDLAEKCIKKKTHFALDILYYSTEEFDNWEIPSYMKEGLQWLKKN